MKLSAYLKRFGFAERADFALAVGTTVGHLNNVAYGMRTASAALARAISDRTARDVAEWELRPDDWHLIWPELASVSGAPPVPGSCAEASEGSREASHAH
jgi:DNA-binding transcriptional regulator YdaS (Cro superfamily)